MTHTHRSSAGSIHFSGTIPSVDETWKAVAEAKLVVRQARRATNPRFNDVAAGHEAARAARTQERVSHEFERYMAQVEQSKRDANAPGGAPLDTPVPNWERTYYETMLQAELDLLEQYAMTHCHKVSGAGGGGGGCLPPSGGGSSGGHGAFVVPTPCLAPCPVLRVFIAPAAGCCIVYVGAPRVGRSCDVVCCFVMLCVVV